ncbi:hypothetical protein CUMW_218950 [Citrus unshiu]|nr:hypothetical protein CUMW_218950 [Citrus unshiu]
MEVGLDHPGLITSIHDLISAFNTFLYFLLFLFLMGRHVPSVRNKRMKEIDKQIRASLMGITKNR